MLGVPTGPVGERKTFKARLSLSAREVASFLHVDLELPRVVAGEQSEGSAAREEVPPGGHVLLVDTHVMGRAKIDINYLLFVTSDGNSLSKGLPHLPLSRN